MKRFTRLAGVLGVTVLASTAFALTANTPVGAGIDATILFSENTPDAYSLEVPAGVCFVTIEAAGGQGGDGSSGGAESGRAATVGGSKRASR